MVVARLNITALAPTSYSINDTNAARLDVLLASVTDTAGRAVESNYLPPGLVVIPGIRVTIGNQYSYYSVVKGDMFEIPVRLEIHDLAAPTGLKGYDVRIGFDNTRLKFVTAIGGPPPFNAGPTRSPFPAVNYVTLRSSHEQATGPKGSFVVANLVFSALSTAPTGYTPLTLTINSLADPAGNILPAVPVNGTVYIQTAPPTYPAPPAPAPPGVGAPAPPGPPGAGGAPGPAPKPTAAPTTPPPVIAGGGESPAPTPTPAAAAARGPGGGSAPALPAPPVAPAAPGPAAGAGAPPAGNISALVIAPLVNPRSDARDASGTFVPPTPGEKISIRRVNGVLTMVMPVSVPRDTFLKTFNDPASGVTFDGNKLSVPIRGSDGNLQMTLAATTGNPVGAGSSAAATVEKLELRTAPATADFSPADPKVGKAAAAFDLELKSLPEGASLDIQLARAPDTAVQRSVSLALEKAGGKLLDTAFAVTVARNNLKDDDAGPATITLSVGKAWADAFAAAKIAITRTADNGFTEILATKRLGDVGDSATFEAVSPGGLSTFTLVALQTPPSRAATVPSSDAAPPPASPSPAATRLPPVTPSPAVPQTTAAVTPSPLPAAVAPAGPPATATATAATAAPATPAIVFAAPSTSDDSPVSPSLRDPSAAPVAPPVLSPPLDVAEPEPGLVPEAPSAPGDAWRPPASPVNNRGLTGFVFPGLLVLISFSIGFWFFRRWMKKE